MHALARIAQTFIRRQVVGPVYLPYYMKRKAEAVRGSQRASVFVSAHKAYIAEAILGDGPIAHLGSFRPQDFGVSQAIMRKAVVNLLARLEAPHLVVWGRKDRAAIGIDLDACCQHVARCEVALLPNPFPNARRKFSGYVVDYGGPYYDGSAETSLEVALNVLRPGWWERDAEAISFLEEFRASAVTKYMSAAAKDAELPSEDDLLVLGQCTGDHSVIYTAGSVKGNLDLIETALSDTRAGQKVIYRAHPKNPANEVELAVIRERFKDRISLMDPAISFVQALSNKPHVVTMTSGAGLEAAVRGCRVTCHSVAFFSNWGFTWDMTPCPRRMNRLSAEDVFLYFYMRHSRYFHPYSEGEISPLEALRGRLGATGPMLSAEPVPSPDLALGLTAILS